MKKFCTKCKQVKLISNFSKDKRAKDGLQCACKECNKKNYNYDKEKSRKRYQDNIEAKREYQRQYSRDFYYNHKGLVRKRKRIRERQRRKEDILFKMKNNLRSSVRHSLKKHGFSKKSRTQQIIGCSIKFLKSYLFENAKIRYQDFEPKKFLEKNKYHIDHIIPLVTAKTEEEVLRLWHYTNLQLLTREDNLTKLDKIDWKFETI